MPDNSAGPQGEKGEQGEEGIEGPTGAQGKAGRAGIEGPEGPEGAKGAQGRPGRDAVATAAELVEEVRENTRALKKLTHRQLRWITVVIFTAASLFLSFAASVTNWNTQQISCQRDNQLRQAEQDLWSPVIKASEEMPPPGPDASQFDKDNYERQQKLKAVFVHALETGFTKHDCDNNSVWFAGGAGFTLVAGVGMFFAIRRRIQDDRVA